MDTVVRAAKGALRSSTRTLIVVLVLAVGLSFALTSVALALAAEDELDKIRKTTGVEATLTVNPEQFQQAISAALEEAGGDPSKIDREAVDSQIEQLTDEHLNAIEQLPYVRRPRGRRPNLSITQSSARRRKSRRRIRNRHPIRVMALESQSEGLRPTRCLRPQTTPIS